MARVPRFRHAAHSLLCLSLLILAVVACQGKPDGHRGASSAQCRRSSPEPVIVYGVGTSTNPDIGAVGSGTGLASITPGGEIRKVWQSARTRWGFEGSWLGLGRLVAENRSGNLVLVCFDAKERLLLPLEPVHAPWPLAYEGSVWAPDGSRLAATQAVPASTPNAVAGSPRGIVSSARVAIIRPDGTGRIVLSRAGFVLGWGPRDELAVVRGGDLVLLDAADGRRMGGVSNIVLGHAAGGVSGTLGVSIAGPLVAWSADGRYFATQIDVRHTGPRPLRRGGTIAIVRDMPPYRVQIVSSSYEISMFAWAPVGDRFAYTTSGFPSPHQLIVGAAGARSSQVLLTQVEHFDWVTWSPDGLRLLIDNQLHGSWDLFYPTGRSAPQHLPRLGGQPLWCCSTSRSMGD